MNQTEYETQLRISELETIKINQDWQKNVQVGEAQQEVVRRGIEALYTAAKVGTLITGDDEKNIRKLVSAKLTEFIGKLKPIN